MKQSVIFNSVGTGLIVVAIVLHIVCMATPYYSEADLNEMGKKMADLISKDQSIMGQLEPDPKTGQPLTQVASILEGFLSVQGYINFGLWKLCAVEDTKSMHVKICLDWGSETTFEHDTGRAKTLETGGWMRGAQALATIGVLLGALALVLAIINLVVRSKGDRLRLIHIFISCTCVATGIFILVGALIVAANYKDVFDPMMLKQRVPTPPVVMDLIKGLFHLSWGFALDIVAVALILLSGLAHLMGGRIALSENGAV